MSLVAIFHKKLGLPPGPQPVVEPTKGKTSPESKDSEVPDGEQADD